MTDDRLRAIAERARSLYTGSSTQTLGPRQAARSAGLAWAGLREVIA